MLELLHYLDPRPDSLIDWFVLACVVVLVSAIIIAPQLKKFQKWLWSGITCLAFGVSGVVYEYSPRLGGLCFIVTGLACIWVAAKLLAALAVQRTLNRSPLLISSGQAAFSLPQTTQFLPDSTTSIKQLPDRTS